MVIDSTLIDQILTQLRESFPDEACGIIASTGDVAARVFPIKNISESPVIFRMDPKEQLDAMLAIEDAGWDVGAIYHSHTRTRAYPSATDVKMAFYPDALQIIISLGDAAHPDIRAFRIQDGEIQPVELEIVG